MELGTWKLGFMILIFLFIIGLAIGSFLNVLIDRLPQGQSIMGRSHCDHCKKNLEAIDLIPVFSYLYLKGRCRRCKKRLSMQYPLIELLTGVIFVLVWLYIPSFTVISSGMRNLLIDGISHFVRDDSAAVRIILLKMTYLGVFASLIAIFFADLKYHIIPDELQVSLLILSLLVIGLEQGFTLQIFFAQVMAGLAVMAFILAIYLLTRGRGMGFGDVKLSFTMGYLLGILGGYTALGFAFVSGSIVGLLLIFIGRKKLKSEVAFGPFLVLGIIVALFFRPALYPDFFGYFIFY